MASSFVRMVASETNTRRSRGHADVRANARPRSLPAVNSPSGRVAIQVAVLAGLLFGVIAQLLRQVDGSLMELGAATAPWVTLGFAIAVWATRRNRSLRDGSMVGATAMAAYLFTWIVSFHVLYAVRESVGLAAGWREAAPWLVLGVPACLVLGLLAACSHRRGILGDVCLASPIAWSLPEVVEGVEQGWPGGAVLAVPTAALALLPLVVTGRRDVRLVTFVLAAVVLGGLALALSSFVRSQIPS
jgi:hypothetical protein